MVNETVDSACPKCGTALFRPPTGQPVATPLPPLPLPPIPGTAGVTPPLPLPGAAYTPTPSPLSGAAPASPHLPSQAPPPGSMPAGGGPGPYGNPVGQQPVQRTHTRVSLTGEVIEDEAPAQQPNSVPLPQPGPANHGMPAGATRAAYPGSYARRDTELPGSGDKALMINLTVFFVFLVLCVGGGYWKWTHRTNPKSQVERYLHVVQWLDWGVVYDLSATPPGNRSRHDFISWMNDKYDNNGVLKIIARHAYEQAKFTVGEPTIEGDEATVPVSMSMVIVETKKPLLLKLKNFGGVWKIYPISENPTDIIEKAMEEQTPPDDKLPPGGDPSAVQTPGADTGGSQ